MLEYQDGTSTEGASHRAWHRVTLFYFEASPFPSTTACLKDQLDAPLLEPGALRVTDGLLMLEMVTVLPSVVPVTVRVP